MTILAVGDEVDDALLGEDRPQRCADVRLIVSCGDLPADYLEGLMDRFGVPLLHVRGNHDAGEAPPGDDADGRVIIAGGLRILGFEGSRWYNGKGVQYGEREMWWRVLRARPAIWRARGVDVIVTHAPPHGIHDGADVAHTGFRVFRRLIETVRPRYFIHGHNHLSYVPQGARSTTVGETTVVNAFRSIVLPLDVSARRPA